MRWLRRVFRRADNGAEAATANRAAADKDPGSKTPLGPWSCERTRILPEALKGLDSTSTPNILDAGPAEPQSIDFFGRFRCRLYVANLYNPAVPAHGAESAPAFFETVDRVRFDVCLLWDYINYADGDGLAEFMSILSDRVHRRTRLYAIGAYMPGSSLRACRYAISDIDRLAIRPAGGIVPQPRSRNDIDTFTHRFAVHKAALRRDNRLELLLRTVPKRRR